jgi:hypothetical protein
MYFLCVFYGFDFGPLGLKSEYKLAGVWQGGAAGTAP